ncbi:alpha/beta fold hydrolase BchO [Novosphingobium piscinae]|uniref:Alpha/beta fold hydrolase n=1 Tax=Novosphingobium piscinae TaxID=1507448 RepID=A0A7X1FX56_9SPHN|nr:alpha/beta fold hydrolase BchO [Novosphingobium piscinae]MBC2668499.1 alpha/beta fold hydrolase [Novosphingobium piscinae]
MSVLRWEVEGRNWPHRAASRFVSAAGLRWHVQIMGSGPPLVLLHGTGAATHSWREVLPLLAADYTVIAPDLPGHGFTTGRPRGGLSLPGMAEAVAGLLAALDAAHPAGIVGHSAGAAVALQIVRQADPQDRAAAAIPLVGLNPALMPFPGLAARLFPSLARLLFVNPLVPRMMAGIASLPGEPERFLERATGSSVDAAGLAGYRTLFRNPGHCAGAIEMMASWDLEGLSGALATLTNPVLLVHAERDSAVPLDSIERAAVRLPHARLDVWPALGHLAHEQRPDLAALAIRRHVEAERDVRHGLATADREGTG